MLQGSNVHLRLVRESDLDTYIALSNDLEIRGDYFPLQLIPAVTRKREFSEDGYWGDAGGVMVLVPPDDDGRLLGRIFFFKPSTYWSTYEIAYTLFDRERRNRGLMTEALGLFTRYLFAVKPVNRLQLTILPGNHASRRVAEKCSYRSEGIMRQAMFLRGEFRDLEMFSIVRAELES